MRKRLRVALDLIALVLLGLGLFAALAVTSHDPADPPRARVHPANAKATNLCGETGAILADSLIEFFGWSVYLVLAAWLVLVLTLFFEGRRGVWSWRLLGWLILVPASSLIFACFSGLIPVPPGVLGESLFQALMLRTPALVTYLTAAGSVLVGLALGFDFFWPRVFGAMGRSIRHLGQRLRGRRLKTDLGLIPIHHPNSTPAVSGEVNEE